MSDWQYLNFPAGEPLPQFNAEGQVTLKTKPKTDVWRKPPTIDDFNAPFMYKALPASRFKRVRVTAVGKFSYLYDQAGLLIVLPPTKSNPQGPRRWLKTGIEFYQQRPHMSVVVADGWADWSLLPLPAADEEAGRFTVVVEREHEEDGSYSSVLRVLLVDGEREMPIREVMAAFHDLDEEQEIWVGIAVAKPQPGGAEVLEATFHGFEVETRD